MEQYWESEFHIESAWRERWEEERRLALPADSVVVVAVLEDDFFFHLLALGGRGLPMSSKNW
jgi:hypothetical protein